MLAALDKGVKGNKWFSLIDKVIRSDVLELAWAKVQSNAGACGVDGITVERFEKDSQKRLLAVKKQLEEGSYQPQPVKRVWIPKPGSAEKRPLGIPTVRDRVVQTALKMVIEPIFEREFAAHSYGFRPGRSCHDALRRVEELLKSGHLHVVDIDIKGYFDSIPQPRLMELVEERIADGRVLELIATLLKQGVMEEMRDWEPESGTPQGGVDFAAAGQHLSQSAGLASGQSGIGNGALRRRYGRALPPRRGRASARDGQGWMERAGLVLHPQKTRIVAMTQAGGHFDFLGYRFWRGRKES